MERTLGLDIGTNSVGWAVVDVPGDGETGAVIAVGSRVFPEGVEISGSAMKTKAAERRQKRLMRRQIDRRSKRKATIRRELARIGLLPSESAEFDRLMDLDPAELLSRSEAGEVLSLLEIGRVLYWFSARRGFLSLRAGGNNEMDNDQETEKPWRLNQFDADTGERKVVGQEEKMIEFLEAQRIHHPDIITDALVFGRRGRQRYPVKPISSDDYQSGPDGSMLDEFGVHGLLFFQRKVYWKQSTIGECSLNVGSRQPRALRADRLAQNFKIWRTIADLRVGDQPDPTNLKRKGRPLTQPEKEKVYAKLSTQKTFSFAALRKLLGLDPEDRINFDTGRKRSLEGHETDAALGKSLGKIYKNLSDEDKNKVVWLLLGNGTKEESIQQFQAQFGFSSAEAEAALIAKLPSGRSNYSRQTLRELMKYIPSASTERDAIRAAGFSTPEEARASKPVELDKITNPIVRATLIEVGKVVKAVAREYGHQDRGLPFDAVRIELARDVRNSAERRIEISRNQDENRKKREWARNFIEEYRPGTKISRDDITRCILWDEQGQRCLYSGKPITPQAALSAQTEIDHILPRSRTLNNSHHNRALVYTKENRDKGDRTIFEWKGQVKVDEVLARAKSNELAWRKRTNIETEHVPEDGLPSSMLVTTGYINGVARDYVKHLVEVEPEVTTGTFTWIVREQMGVRKNRDDYRNHGLDAVMVCLTTRSMIQRVSRIYKWDMIKEVRGSWEPWSGAREEILAVYDNALTSHKPRRKVSGQFVQETLYGDIRGELVDLADGLTRIQLNDLANSDEREALRNDLIQRGLNPDKGRRRLTFDPESWPTLPDGTEIRTVHLRGPVARRRDLSSGLTRNQFTEVADPIVKQALEDDLIKRGRDPKASKLKFGPEAWPRMPDGTEIRSVRCHLNRPANLVLKPDTEPKTSREPGENQVAVVVRNRSTGQLRVDGLSRWDVINHRSQSALTWARRLEENDEEAIFTLALGETLELTASDDTEPSYYVIRTIEPSAKRVRGFPVNDSMMVDKRRLLLSGRVLAEYASVRKVVIGPAGTVRSAND